MNPDLHVDPEYLDGFVTRIDEATANIQSLLDNLDASVSVLGREWTGAASAAYADAHRDWTRDIAAMNATLVKLSRAVKLSNDDYRETESQNAKVWR